MEMGRGRLQSTQLYQLKCDKMRSLLSHDKVRAHRNRLRQQGLRPIQIWVPDLRSPAFVEEAHRQSLAVPGVLMPGRIRTLSIPSPTGTEREARRDLGSRWWQGRRGKAQSNGNPLRRPFRHDGFRYGVCLHDRSNRCSSFSSSHQVEQD